MDEATIRIVQGYAYWFCTLVLTVVLVSYIIHLYRNQRKGFDYEKYSRLALDDRIQDTIIESRGAQNNKKES